MRARLLLLLPLVACGADPDAVTVKLSLDSSSCPVEVPEAVTLSCAATAGVWLRGPDGEELGRACVDFGEETGGGDGGDGDGAGATLGSLPALLGDVSLSTEEAGAVSVEVAVYAGWSAAQGCPAPDDAQALDVPPAIVVAGRSTPARLADSDGAVQIVLRCESIAPLPAGDQCEELCLGQEEECLAGLNAEQCDAEFGGCVRGCEGDECAQACEGEYESCLGESPDGLCTLDEERCLDGCGEGEIACEVDCGDVNDACYEAACGQVFLDCVESCSPDEGTCATYTP